jgi:transposase InsO family protein
MPKTIISDWDAKFTSNFWKSLFIGFRMQLAFITAYHPQIDGKNERVNIVMEDMMRMYVMH